MDEGFVDVCHYTRECSVVLTDCTLDPAVQRYLRPTPPASPERQCLKKFSLAFGKSPPSPVKTPKMNKLGFKNKGLGKKQKSALFEKSKLMAKEYLKVKWTPRKKASSHNEWVSALSRSIPDNNKDFGVDFSDMPSQFAATSSSSPPSAMASPTRPSSDKTPQLSSCIDKLTNRLTAPQENEASLVKSAENDLLADGKTSPNSLTKLAKDACASEQVVVKKEPNDESQPHNDTDDTANKENEKKSADHGENKESHTSSVIVQEPTMEPSSKPGMSANLNYKLFTYRCPTCLASFRNKDALAAHIDGPVHSEKNALSISYCPYCYIPVNCKDLLALHLNGCHGEQLKKGSIEFDGKTVAVNYKDLLKEEDLSELKSEDIFACQACDKDYESFHMLHYHLFSEHNSKVDAFCALCKTTVQRADLDKHKDAHKGVEHAQCYIFNKFRDDILSSFFIVSKIIDNDDNVLADESSVTEFKCKFCAYETDSLGRIKSHIDVHLDVTPAKCNICSERIRNTSDIYNHYLQHNNVSSSMSMSNLLKSQFFTSQIVRSTATPAPPPPAAPAPVKQTTIFKLVQKLAPAAESKQQQRQSVEPLCTTLAASSLSDLLAAAPDNQAKSHASPTTWLGHQSVLSAVQASLPKSPLQGASTSKQPGHQSVPSAVPDNLPKSHSQGASTSTQSGHQTVSSGNGTPTSSQKTIGKKPTRSLSSVLPALQAYKTKTQPRILSTSKTTSNIPSHSERMSTGASSNTAALNVSGHPVANTTVSASNTVVAPVPPHSQTMNMVLGPGLNLAFEPARHNPNAPVQNAQGASDTHLVPVHIPAVWHKSDSQYTFCINNQDCRMCTSICEDTQSPAVLDKEPSPELLTQYTIEPNARSVTGRSYVCKLCSFKTQYCMIVERHVLYHQPMKQDAASSQHRCNVPGCNFSSSFRALFDHHAIKFHHANAASGGTNGGRQN